MLAIWIGSAIAAAALLTASTFEAFIENRAVRFQCEAARRGFAEENRLLPKMIVFVQENL